MQYIQTIIHQSGHITLKTIKNKLQTHNVIAAKADIGNILVT